MRNYSKRQYANQSDEQKKEKAKRRKEREQDKGKKENKMTTETIRNLTKIPGTVYKTIQNNRDETKPITTRRVVTRKCDCATSEKTSCIKNCSNANRTL